MRRHVISTVVFGVSKVEGRLIPRLLDPEYEGSTISRSAGPVTRRHVQEYSNLQHRHGEVIKTLMEKVIL